MRKTVLLVSTFLFFGLTLQAQIQSCPTGTMANVLGTSCSVGAVIFNFGTEFQGVNDNGSLFPANIAPADVGFIPVQSGDQAGFKLIFNFADAPAMGFVERFVGFICVPQAAPSLEIRSQSLSIDSGIQAGPAGTAFVDAVDAQFYPNSGPLVNIAEIDFENGVAGLNRPSQSQILEVPGLASIGSGLSGLPDVLTTQVATIATAGNSVSLASATYLYTTGPVVPAPGLAPLTYTNIDLPGVAATFVSNITNSGRLVGTYQDFDGIFHGYIEETDGSFSTIDVPGASATFGTGLNEQGDVVGTFTGQDRRVHGFLQHDGVITTIDVPGARRTAPIAINNQGQIVGEFRSADLGFHGFLLDNGIFTTIDNGPGTGRFADSAAFGINNSGEIGGTFFDPNTFRSYLLKDGGTTIIDVPGQGDTTIEAINDRNDSVGIFNDINLAQHGFVLSRGRFQTVDFPDGSFTFALGINDPGTIVGQYTAADGSAHSFLATPAVDDGNDHRPANSMVAPQTRPNCNEEDWHLQRDQLRNPRACQVQQQ
jgi:uncharacterized membrane protein